MLRKGAERTTKEKLKMHFSIFQRLFLLESAKFCLHRKKLLILQLLSFLRESCGALNITTMMQCFFFLK